MFTISYKFASIKFNIQLSGVQSMFLAVSSFAVMNVAVKYLANFSAMELVCYRAFITLIISGFYLYKNKINIKGNNTGLLILRGVFGSLGLYCYFATVSKMNLASAVVLQYTSPIFTIIIASIFLKEKVIKLQWFAFLICLAGLVMVKQFGKIEPLYFGFGIASAFFSGCAYNVIRKLKHTESPNLIVFYFPLVTLPIAFIFLVFQKTVIIPNFEELIWILIMGISTQIAQYAMTVAYQKDTAARISSISYFGLGYALLFGILMFNEKPNHLEIIGFLIIVFGVLTNLYANKILYYFRKN